MRSFLVALVALFAAACDAPSQPPPSQSPPPVEPAKDEPPPSATPPSETPPSEPPPSEPPAPVGGPHCDQRELAGKSGEPKRMCVDFSAHTGVTEVRCFEGAALSDGACPSEGVIGKCTLASTGVALLHYEGAKLPAAREACEASGGSFE